jgi:PAS domain S-box-containing protein
LDLGIFPNIDLSPVAFVLSALVIGWSIFRYHLFDVVPVARRITVDTMRDGMIVLDVQNRVIDMNPAALVVFNVQLADVLGKGIADLLIDWPDLVDTFKDIWEVETEIRLEEKGEEQYFELQISPLLNSRKRVNGRLIVFHDITSYKQTEAALAEARDEALEVSRVKTELLARVSHELRTPLNVILGFSEMMQLGISGSINEKQYETLDKILESTRFLTAQVNDLLSLSSIEAGTTKLYCHDFSIIELIDEVILKCHEDAEKKSLKLVKTNSDASLNRVYGDRDGVTQILTNLVENAIKFSSEGKINIDTFAYDDDFWALRVSDEGPGIPAEAYDLIFEPFRQIDGSMTRIHGGTGLGLAIVKQMTELMGGFIQLESVMGQGSTFTVLLPNEGDVLDRVVG